MAGVAQSLKWVGAWKPRPDIRQSQEFLFSSHLADQFWGSHSLIFIVYRAIYLTWLKGRKREDFYSPPSSDEGNNACRYTSAPNTSSSRDA
jgi:hypothetical protein